MTDFRSAEERLALGRERVCRWKVSCTLFLQQRGPMSPLLFLPNDFESGPTVPLLEGPFGEGTVEGVHHCRETLEAPPREGVCWPLPREPEPPRREPLLGPPLSLPIGGLEVEEDVSLFSGFFWRLGILKPEEDAWLLCATEEAMKLCCWESEFNFWSSAIFPPKRDSAEIGTERSLDFVVSVRILDLSMAASLLACRSSTAKTTDIEEECFKQVTIELSNLFSIGASKLSDSNALTEAAVKRSAYELMETIFLAWRSIVSKLLSGKLTFPEDVKSRREASLSSLGTLSWNNWPCDRCNRPEFPPSQFFPRGKTGPAHSFPGEKTESVFSPPSQFFPPL